jgi:hypothetical protein
MTASPVRVQHRRGEHARPGLVIVRRPYPFGNPFRADDHGGRAGAVDEWAAWMAGAGEDTIFIPGPKRETRYSRSWVLAHLDRIAEAGEVGCDCPLDGGPCHGEALIELARSMPVRSPADRAILAALATADARRRRASERQGMATRTWRMVRSLALAKGLVGPEVVPDANGVPF